MDTPAPESRTARAARIAALTALVRDGGYPAPDPVRLAGAMVRWHNRMGRSNGMGRRTGESDAAHAHRNAYQREYMQRRRASQATAAEHTERRGDDDGTGTA